jgi:hypothetical protein
VGNSSSDSLAQIATGNYRLLPYAIEFWIEHCFLYANAGGFLNHENPLSHYLARLYDAHNQCQQRLGTSAIQVDKTVEAQHSHADDRLECFSQMPIQELMKDVLCLRQLASRFDGENSTGEPTTEVRVELKYGNS